MTRLSGRWPFHSGRRCFLLDPGQGGNTGLARPSASHSARQGLQRVRASGRAPLTEPGPPARNNPHPAQVPEASGTFAAAHLGSGFWRPSCAGVSRSPQQVERRMWARARGQGQVGVPGCPSAGRSGTSRSPAPCHLNHKCGFRLALRGRPQGCREVRVGGHGSGGWAEAPDVRAAEERRCRGSGRGQKCREGPTA